MNFHYDYGGSCVTFADQMMLLRLTFIANLKKMWAFSSAGHGLAGIPTSMCCGNQGILSFLYNCWLDLGARR